MSLIRAIKKAPLSGRWKGDERDAPGAVCDPGICGGCGAWAPHHLFRMDGPSRPERSAL